MANVLGWYEITPEKTGLWLEVKHIGAPRFVPVHANPRQGNIITFDSGDTVNRNFIFKQWRIWEGFPTSDECKVYPWFSSEELANELYVIMREHPEFTSYERAVLTDIITVLEARK